MLREAGLATGQLLGAVAVFTLVAMLPYLAGIGYQNFGGAAAARRLGAFKTTLICNGQALLGRAPVWGIAGR